MVEPLAPALLMDPEELEHCAAVPSATASCARGADLGLRGIVCGASLGYRHRRGQRPFGQAGQSSQTH